MTRKNILNDEVRLKIAQKVSLEQFYELSSDDAWKTARFLSSNLFS
jgi:hypothetical protein